jgi:hypothetical protein
VQQAITNSGPELRNIGAATTGRRNGCSNAGTAIENS